VFETSWLARVRRSPLWAVAGALLWLGGSACSGVGAEQGATKGSKASEVSRQVRELARVDASWAQHLDESSHSWRRAGNVLEGRADSTVAYFAGGLVTAAPTAFDSPLRWTLPGDSSAEFAALDATASAAEVVGSQVVYRDAFPGVDAVVVSGSSFAELFYLLRDEHAPNTFRFSLRGGPGVLVEAGAAGATFKNLQGETLLALAPMGIVDAHGERRVAKQGFEGGVLSVNVDTAGLTFPILVDPYFSSPSWQVLAGTPVSINNVVSLGDRLVGFGFQTTYEWNGTDWAAAGGAGPTQDGCGAAFGGKVVYLEGSGSLAKFWTWNGSSWSSSATTNYNCGSPCAAAEQGGKLVVARSDTTCEWDGATWRSVVGATPLSPSFSSVMSFKGQAQIVNDDSIYSWNGSSWAASAAGPAFGGLPYLHRAFSLGPIILAVEATGAAPVYREWNGNSWSTPTIMNSPQFGGQYEFLGAWRGSLVGQFYNNEPVVAFQNKVAILEPNLGNGAACTWQEQCYGDVTCTDGVCCSDYTSGFSGACTEECHACLASKTGQPDGTCAPILDGTDPDNECSVQGTGDCKNPGYCSGALRACNRTTDNICVQASCSSATTQVGVMLCNSTGNCSVGGAVTNCSPYICQGTGCRNSCTIDGDCQSGFFCNTKNKKCEAVSGAGQACGSDGQCGAGGHCVDGFCCDSACGGTCYACSAAKTGLGNNGVCGPIQPGSDPDSECPETDPKTCSFTGVCNGQGACAIYPKSTPCGITTCKADLVSGQTCDGQGICKSDASGVPCFPNLHCGSATECATLCTGDAQCAAGYYCDTGGTGKCELAKSPASQCTRGTQCGSTFCVDGVCCDTKCEGQCEACNQPNSAGICIAVDTAPVAPRVACAGKGACAGTCNGGNRVTCTFPDTATECGPASCRDDSVIPASTCDGNGKCAAAEPQPCGDYTCDADSGSCKSSCSTSADCRAGATCITGKGHCTTQGATCPDDYSVKAPDGSISSCHGFKCVAGACQQQCQAAGDCAPDYECKAARCVAASTPDAGDGGAGQGGAGPSPGSDDPVPAADAGAGSDVTTPLASASDPGGCGCRLGSRSERRAPGVWLLLGLVAAASSRRGRRRRLLAGPPGSVRVRSRLGAGH
jgi:hypothetical protein